MRPKGLFLLGNVDAIFAPDDRAEIERLLDIYSPPQSSASVADTPEILREAEVILSSWGAPVMDDAFLANAPNLKAVFYAAGTIRYIVTDAFWNRGIVITSSYAANAIPVAEYTLSQILFSLKKGWQAALALKSEKRWGRPADVPGAYRRTVGIISLGMIGRKVAEFLKAFDLRVVAYDPFASPEAASALGVELCSLEDLFRASDVVTLHAPWLKETEGMIGREHFASMKPSAFFINTSRGAIVREQDMIEVLRDRPDLFALLDVTNPEPPSPESPLYTLPNVILTPHIAGSMGSECHRMGRYAVEELKRYLNGEPLKWRITREMAGMMA